MLNIWKRFNCKICQTLQTGIVETKELGQDFRVLHSQSLKCKWKETSSLNNKWIEVLNSKYDSILFSFCFIFVGTIHTTTFRLFEAGVLPLAMFHGSLFGQYWLSWVAGLLDIWKIVRNLFCLGSEIIWFCWYNKVGFV